MKIDVEKLRAALVELGLEEDQIESALAAASGEEGPVDPEGEGEEPSTSGDIPVEEEVAPSEEPAPEGEGEVETPQEEVPADPESVPPAEEPQPEVPPQEPVPEEVPPAEELPPVPPVPQGVPLEEFEAVKADLEEQKKANEGLASQIASLKEALVKAGVIEGSVASSVGLDQPSAPVRQEQDTTLDDVLREINQKGY